MMEKSVTIIGAGIAGLTVGRCLLHHGIKATIYEKASNKPRHNYGITLHGTAYHSLNDNLRRVGQRKVDYSDSISEFRRAVAVDAEVGGGGKLESNSSTESSIYNTDHGFRVNRFKLEEFLKTGLDVRYECAVNDVRCTADGRPQVHFDNGNVVTTDLLIGADGPHSVVRKKLLSHVEMEVLPLVAYNGKRRISGATWTEVYEPVMQDITALEEKHGDALLCISINERKKDQVNISWTYSRPPRGEDDALHRPGRANADAERIPEAFFQEIGALENLQQPFSDVFDSKKLRGDKILHWLMRRTLVPLEDLQTLRLEKNVVLIGDAVHAEPIIGGNGANAAILDGIQLARAMISLPPLKERMGKKKGSVKPPEAFSIAKLQKRYNTAYPYWELAQKENEERMRRMHGLSREQANL